MNEAIAIFIGTDMHAIRMLEKALGRFRLSLISISQSCGLLELLGSSQPRIVLIDVEAPGVDCLAILSGIRGDPELAGATVLLHSAEDETSLARRAAGCGADGSVPKAKDARALRLSLSRWLSR